MAQRASDRRLSTGIAAVSLVLAVTAAYVATLDDPAPASRSADLAPTTDPPAVGSAVHESVSSTWSDSEPTLLREVAGRRCESFEREVADRAADWGCALAADGTPVVPEWLLRHAR